MLDLGLILQSESQGTQDAVTMVRHRKGSALSLTGWLDLLRECRLLDGPIGGVSERDAATIFCWSRSAVVAESLNQSYVLQRADFLEGFARLSDLVREEINFGQNAILLKHSHKYLHTDKPPSS